MFANEKLVYMNEASAEIADDKRKEKLCLIEDIIKAKKNLYGMGQDEYRPIVLDPEPEFDRLYELGLSDLQAIDRWLTTEVNRVILLKFKKL